MASIRPVGVLDRSVGHAASRMSSAFAVAPLSSSSAARWVSSGSTVCAMRSIGQSVKPAVCPLQRSVPTARAPPDFDDLPDRGVGAAITLRIAAECALVEVVVGVRPERVVRMGVEGVIDEVIVGIWPEHGSDPADDDRPRPMPLPSRIEESPLECRTCQRGCIAPSPPGSAWQRPRCARCARAAPVGVCRLRCRAGLDLSALARGDARCRSGLRALPRLAALMFA